MNQQNDTTQTAKREVTITRVFDAPRELVWRAWTDSEHLRRWWGPHGFTNPVCELDLRPGGSIKIVMRAPYGIDYLMIGTFNEIVPIERLVFTSTPVDDDGKPQLEALTTATFAEVGAKTKLTVHQSAVGLTEASVRMLAGMEIGWTQSIERLEELVATC